MKVWLVGLQVFVLIRGIGLDMPPTLLFYLLATILLSWRNLGVLRLFAVDLAQPIRAYDLEQYFDHPPRAERNFVKLRAISSCAPQSYLAKVDLMGPMLVFGCQSGHSRQVCWMS